MKINCVNFVENIRKGMDLTEPKELVIIQVGNNPASDLYIKSKQKEAKKWNVNCKVINLHENSSTFDVIKAITRNSDSDGIIVQLPLPSHIHEQEVIDAIPPELNVDGFKQTMGVQLYEPCTPKGIIMLLEHYFNLQGKTVTLIGRGKTVGEPLRDMLLAKNCTVTVCHSHTPENELRNMLKCCDIIISAVGKPNLFNVYDTINEIFVVDAGISRINGKQVGDFSHVDLDVFDDSVHYTPWTNGVGKLTVMALMLNVRKTIKWEIKGE